jgi:uncharacterized protein
MTNSNITLSIVIIMATIVIGVVTVFFYNITFGPGITRGSEEVQREQQTSFMEEQISSGSDGYQQVNVSLNGFPLVADISITGEQKTRGLSVKDTLNENEGMLFVFENEAEHIFWMKDMRFPIDIIWLDSNKTIIHIEHNVQPCSFGSFCPTYKPDGNSLYVLETVAGFANKYAIVQGTQAEFELDA